VNTKYFILIAAILAVIHCLAGSAPVATPANVASQAKVAPVAPSSSAPSAPVAQGASVGAAAPAAPVAPVSTAPIAPIAPTPPQSVNSNFPANPYAYSYNSNSAYFTNGIPTAYLRNTNSFSWATNAPYGNPIAGYTNNNNFRIFNPTSTPVIQQ
jgi:hypothetical protein